MKYFFLTKFLNYFLVFFFTIFLTSCGKDFFKYTPVKDTPTKGIDRAKKNVEEGRGVSLGGLARGGRTTYEFSTSNPMWRASLEILDFLPMTTVDYSGGVIITDWYSDSGNANDAIKITLRFLSNEIQSNSIKVIVHNKKCNSNNNCKINEIDSNIKFELQKSILSKAAMLEKEVKKSKK